MLTETVVASNNLWEIILNDDFSWYNFLLDSIMLSLLVLDIWSIADNEISVLHYFIGKFLTPMG